jgi:hypothetical protein
MANLDQAGPVRRAGVNAYVLYMQDTTQYLVLKYFVLTQKPKKNLRTRRQIRIGGRFLLIIFSSTSHFCYLDTIQKALHYCTGSPLSSFTTQKTIILTMSSSISESHLGSGLPILSYKRRIESFSSSEKASTSKGLPNVIFNVRETPKTDCPQKQEMIQDSVENVLAVIGDVEDALDYDVDSHVEIEIELSDELCKPKARTPLRRELLMDNMEMFSRALSRMETDGCSESSDEDDYEYGIDFF